MEDVKDMGKGSSQDNPLTPEELAEALAREKKNE